MPVDEFSSELGCGVALDWNWNQEQMISPLVVLSKGFNFCQAIAKLFEFAV
jgi:hypothetical protein